MFGKGTGYAAIASRKGKKWLTAERKEKSSAGARKEGVALTSSPRKKAPFTKTTSPGEGEKYLSRGVKERKPSGWQFRLNSDSE